MLDFPRWKVWAVIADHPGRHPASRFRACSRRTAGRALADLASERADQPRPRPRRRQPAAARGRHRRRRQAAARRRWRTTVTTELRRGEPRIEIGDVSTTGGRLSFIVRDPTQLDAAVERLRTLTQPVGLTGTRDWDVSVVDSTRIVLTPTEAGGQAGAQGRDDGRPRRGPPPDRSAAEPRKSRSSTRASGGSSSRSRASRIPKR